MKILKVIFKHFMDFHRYKNRLIVDNICLIAKRKGDNNYVLDWGFIVYLYYYVAFMGFI